MRSHPAKTSHLRGSTYLLYFSVVDALHDLFFDVLLADEEVLLLDVVVPALIVLPLDDLLEYLRAREC